MSEKGFEMKTLKRIRCVKNMPKHNKFYITLECGHKYLFDHSVTKMREMPLMLPCKICFCSHR